jgi:hypothetical protein
MGAILLLAFVLRVAGKGSESVDHPVVMILASLIVGGSFLLNQLGPFLVRMLASRADLSSLSPFWAINSDYQLLSYPKEILVLGLLFFFIWIAAPSTSGGRTAFLQGVCVGFLLVPATVLASALVAAVVWLVWKIALVLYVIVKWVLTPVIWLYDHAILPVLRFLATPFIWLWKTYLQEIFAAISDWVWSLLAPLFRFLQKFIFRPLLALVIGVLVSAACLLPVAIIGLSILESVKASFQGALDAQGLYAQGVTIGFLLLDAVVLVVLNYRGILQAMPPISLLILVMLPIITLLRLLVTRPKGDEGENKVDFWSRFAAYRKESRAELLASCVILPILLWAQIQTDD